MIDINRSRYLFPVSQEWLSWVRDYFFTIRVGNKCPWLTVASKRKDFKSYAEKLDFQLKEMIRSYARGRVRIQNRLLAILRFYWIHFDDLILASPTQLETWVNKIKARRHTKYLISMLKDVLVPYYDNISKIYGHNLVNALSIKTCPYCNRQFIYSFEAKRAERPELDHFFPKALFPMFCLSFYNLIPVCHSCNHVKLEYEIGVNPYMNSVKGKFILTDKDGNKLSKSKIYKLIEKQIKIRLEGKSADEDKNIEVLGLDDVYNNHTNYVKELIDKSMAYDAHARKALVESFQGAGYYPRQVYDFVWGRHLMDAEYEDRPLSKLTKDMLDLLGIRRG